MYTIRHALIFAAMFALPAAATAKAATSASDKWNLLFIYLDDYGWRDAGFMGSDFYETPHLDSLAREGMIFTHAYSAAANCAPARACLMSGQYTPRHHLYNVGTEGRGNAAYRRLLHIPGVGTLDPSTTTWAERLRRAGYRTAIMGKWHLSDDPLHYGFESNVGGTHSGSPPAGYYPPHPRAPGLDDLPTDEYLTDTLSDRACDFVRENSGSEWVLFLSHFAVHTPLDPKRELLAKYQEKTPGELHTHVAMATMIEAVDEGVGRILAALADSGTREKTIIVFTSDNGGYGPATDMAPLKGYKGTYYEGGIRVPFFVNWPGVVAPGKTNETPVIGVDLFPTFCEMLGADPSGGEGGGETLLDGVSLVPLLKGEVEELPERSLFWHFPAYLQSYGVDDFEQRDPLFRSRPCSVIRRGDWKLHEYFEKGEFELYDLSEDEGEENDLSNSNPEKLVELRTALEEWRESVGAPVPTERNPAYDEEAETEAIRKASEGGRRKGRKRN